MATASELQSERTKLIAARDRILEGGQDVAISDKRLISARYDHIVKRLKEIDRELAVLNSNGPSRNSGIIKR
jgi:hypothetical protein